MNKFISAIIAVIFILTGLGLAQARVSIKESTTYYNIRAKNPKGVFRQMRRKGPLNLRRKHAVAITLIRLKVDRLNVVKRGRRCIDKNVRVRLTLVYKYPRWRNKKQSSRNARKKWDKYFRQIVKHKKRHGSIAKKMARDVDRSVRKITGRSSRNCSGIKRKFKRVFKKLDKQHDRRQVAFDKKEHRRNSYILKLERAFALSN